MLIGKTLGKYRIVEHVGRGGMAEVYKAYQPGLDRYVAIKVLHTFLAAEPDFLDRFRREARLAAMLRHPNIIQVYDFDYSKEDDAYYMVMEFAEGPTLKMRIQELSERGQLLSLDESIRIVTSVANALDYAHQHGMVHRDVKPANIMFTRDEQVVLTDFGIAKMVGVTGLTASGAMVGTPAYMSPEQGMGHAGDERSDIYSLGVVLYQLCTGCLPFDADTPLGIALKHINSPLPPPATLNASLPPNVESVIKRALAKAPEDRYQSAHEFAADLKQAVVAFPGAPVSAEPSRAPAIPHEVAPSAPWLDRSKDWEMATLPSAPAVPVPARRLGRVTSPPRRWTAIMAAISALILVGGCVAFFATGTARRLLVSTLAQIVATPSVALTATPTPDLTATAAAEAAQFAAWMATYMATAGVTPTPSPTPTATPTATPTPDLTATAFAACVFDVQVVNDRAVSPAVLAPGQRFTKRWTLKNSGTCAWPEGVRLAFVSGDEFEVLQEPEIEPPAPGESIDVQIVLQAPTDYAVYTSVWRLQDSDRHPIGEELQITCRVGPTPTPPPTATPTATPTPLFTATPMERLRFSVPVITSWQDLPGGRWRAQVGLTAWGGDGQYRYYQNVVSPETEFFNGTFEFESQKCANWIGTVIVQSGNEEARWTGVLAYPGTCP